MKLYRVVDYDSKWSTQFHKDCMLDFLNYTFKTSFDISLYILKIVLGPISGTELLQHSKLNCTVWLIMIAIGIRNIIRVVCLETNYFTCKTYFDNKNQLSKYLAHSFCNSPT